jgi:APA family basic amino acid/polyamine antiporter
MSTERHPEEEVRFLAAEETKRKGATMGPPDSGSGGLVQRLGLFSATMIVVGSMIGSGIFLAPSIMAESVQSPGILLGLWVFGGVFTLLGALVYGELAAMAPHAGGQYVFLSQAYSRFWGFLYGWTLLLVIQTGFNAAVSIAFGKFLGVFIPQLGEGNVIFSLGEYQLNSAQLVGCGVIVVLTVINALGVREGAFVQNLFTVLKLGALAALIVAGLALARDAAANFTPLFEAKVGKKAVEMGFMAGLAVALAKALFSYDAWNTVTFVGEEVRDPQRTLPRALIWGCLITTAVYVLTNVAYIANISLPEMQDIKENRVAQVLAEILFGDVGVSLLVVAILISTFGCVNGLILSGARVCYAMARDGLFFPSCGRLHPTRRTPVVALVYQGVWSCVLTLSGTYSKLLDWTTFASVLFGALTVAGVYRLRVTQPDRPRPYRCWGYPVTPALYLLIAVPFLVYLVQGSPGATGIGTLVVLTGIPVYFLFRTGWRLSAQSKE